MERIVKSNKDIDNSQDSHDESMTIQTIMDKYDNIHETIEELKKKQEGETLIQ